MTKTNGKPVETTPEVAPGSVEATLLELGVNMVVLTLANLKNLAKACAHEFVRRKEEAQALLEAGESALREISGEMGVEPAQAPARRGRPVGSTRTITASTRAKPIRETRTDGSVAGARSRTGSKWTLPTGTLEVLRRADAKGGLTREEFPQKFRTQLKYATAAKDDEGFAASIYVTGINANKKEGYVMRLPTGKWKLTKEGLKVAVQQAKDMGEI